MSEVVGNEKDAQKSNEPGKESEDKFVSRTAYEEVSKDMHKYKSTNKELQARLNEMEARIKQAEEAKLEEQQRYEELYKREKEKAQELENNLKQTNEHYVRSVKMTALMRELGEIKPKYLQHADLDSIEVREDGSISSESVTKVANKFREENPELVPSQNAGSITDHDASRDTIQSKDPVDLSKVSKTELRDILSKAQKGGKRFNLE